MPTPRAVALSIAALLTLPLAAGCSGSSTPATSAPSPHPATTSPAGGTTPSSSTDPAGGTTSTGPAPTAAPVRITIKNFGYTSTGPAEPGATVTVTNNDTTAHTVTADTGHLFDVTVAPHATATFHAPTSKGAYKYHCTYHSDMHGTLTVA